MARRISSPLRIDLPVKPSLLEYCRRLVAEGADPAAIVQVFRGETLCFTPMPLARFAALTTEERTDRSIQLIRYRQTTPQSDGYAPLSGESVGPEHD